MPYEHYEIRHIRENRFVSSGNFKEAQSDYCYQWRDNDGSIPWKMFRGQTECLCGPLVCETEIDPWTGTSVNASND